VAVRGGWTGNIAVFAFYTLSGYLMTRILNERYGFSARGTVAFLLKSCAAALARLSDDSLPDADRAVVPSAVQFLFSDPYSNHASRHRDQSDNFGSSDLRLRQWLPLAKPVVTSWSLSIELFSYVLLACTSREHPRGCGLLPRSAQSRWPSRRGIALSVLSRLHMDRIAARNRYGVLQAGFIPFAMGGLFYFHRDALKVRIKTNWLALIVLLIAGHAAMFLGNALTATIGPYLGIGVMFCLLAVWKEETNHSHAGFFRSSVLSPLHRSHAYRRHRGDRSRIEGGKHLRLFRHDLVALALSTGLVPMEHTINLVRQRISSSVRQGEAHGDADPEALIGQPSIRR
jgi:peptidoglycan/LPS O-acetylase OafA/YrhL